MVIIHRQSLQCFINYNFELIVEPKNNIYFRLEDVETERDLKIKVLSWLSRPSCKGVSPYYQKKIRTIINDYLGTDFGRDEMEEIYTYLGNNCNPEKCIQFIDSNYDFDVLLDTHSK